MTTLPAIEDECVFVPHEAEGFARGRVVDVGAEFLTVRLEDGGERRVAYAEALRAAPDRQKDVDDNCNLMFLNEGTLLHNIRARYEQKKIYTYVGNILVSVNPYEPLPALYAAPNIREYRGRSLGVLPPHIFAVADKAFRDMRRTGASQSIVVSGESGAGKTECQKHVLRYLCENYADTDRPIERLILETNPILEAFGNAKTTRNNNSSRFGKFVEVHFDAKGALVGAHVQHYLLEKSRVCVQQAGERNFHVFFQLLRGAPADLRARLSLGRPEDFNYLNRGSVQFFGEEAGAVRDENVDDAADFARLQAALRDVGMSVEGVDAVFRLLAAVLHLGNVEFVEAEGTRGGCAVRSDAPLKKAADLLGIAEEKLREGLTTRRMQTTRGGDDASVYHVQLKPDVATAARDSLAKNLYSRLFDEIVATINRSIPSARSSTTFIGVLDIAGFEFFKSNSFEQFCVNYSNEKLQKFFNDRVLKGEQELYAQEGLNVPRIEFVDNNECIELFEKKASGLLDALDEESRLPRPSAAHFAEFVQTANRANCRLQSTVERREFRDVRPCDGFVVRHYAADVCYETGAFLEKNVDNLHASLAGLMDGSSNPLIAGLFQSTAENAPSPAKKARLSVQSCAAKFRAQLAALLTKLEATGVHFVRCVKPNGRMAPRQFDAPAVLAQLRCGGMGDVLQLMQSGFPSRTRFSALYEMYAPLLPESLAALDARTVVKCLFHAVGLHEADFHSRSSTS
ncbi:Myosin head [Aphelenchoides fujianensis]|nr:Myosin head [Aphelenchoides fujianensis]